MFGRSSASSKCLEAINEMFEFIEMEGDSLLSACAYKMAIVVLSHQMMLKYCPVIKSYFQSAGQKECPSLIWKYIEDENGEKRYSKTDICMLFL